ncbi:hypothetical protein JB92DRAFT_3107844 [Gautieria morchelliformis]|nr:hypothetical protein JB92DRAFT_3107844 [Gautieria morchelliformis]
MAGEGHHALKHDPAIERWYQMRENMYKDFRFTRSATRTSLILMVVIPGMLGWYASRQDLKWNWVGKRKGESLLRQPPPPLEGNEDS